MAIRKYVACIKCNGRGVIPTRPRSEWTNDIPANFMVCPTCHGLGRVREDSLQEPIIEPPKVNGAAQ